MMQKSVLESKGLQKMSLHALQAQSKVYALQEWGLILGVAAGAGALRVAMQGLPNIEPITAMALLAGALFGRYKGALVGASAVWGSNFFVVGGQGPWSIFQVVAFAGIGFMGGFLPKKMNIIYAAVGAIIATVWFDIVMNFSWAAIIGMNPLILFATGMPFFIAHLVSNVTFSASLPYLRGKVHEIAKFEDRELCRALIARLGGGADAHRKPRD